ncbi:hypothetical protein DERP_008341 [Dermatophagoides pteronyssinus]|uniref:Uncharacterized protein n=1 Tax=Dermatophagoides pteronyssinus TaxID=6956 RepID=A0ABQ8J668_DERPT|nr:hypothetical protein DERP_008341 [Dermatophagoides pteronyssinus]
MIIQSKSSLSLPPPPPPPPLSTPIENLSKPINVVGHKRPINSDQSEIMNGTMIESSSSSSTMMMSMFNNNKRLRSDNESIIKQSTTTTTKPSLYPINITCQCQIHISQQQNKSKPFIKSIGSIKCKSITD